MILELILVFLLGILSGTFTGLAPGIHINLIAAILVSLVSKFSFISPLSAVTFIVAMSITHTFIDFIPSIYLGAPEEGTFLSILPGHELFLEGKAHSAVVYTLYGCLSALLVILIFTPIYIYILPVIYESINNIVPFLLIFISCYILLREEKIFLSFCVFALAGALGFLVFNNPVKDPLLPLLSGLFGLSNLFISLNSNEIKVKQKIENFKKIKFSLKEFFKSIIPVSIFTPLFSFLPGLSSSHSATFASELFPQERKGFLFTVGAVNTIMMGLSFVALYSLGKTRSGSSAAIHDIMNTLTLHNLFIILIVIIISGILSFYIGINISRVFAKIVSKISYKKVTLLVIIILFIINCIFTNSLGILVLITSTALGMFTILSDTRRINLMACLIIPVIFYYLY